MKCLRRGGRSERRKVMGDRMRCASQWVRLLRGRARPLSGRPPDRLFAGLTGAGAFKCPIPVTPLTEPPKRSRKN